MDNFLTRLVDRTLGNITVIKPVIAPMFAAETMLMQESDFQLQPQSQPQFQLESRLEVPSLLQSVPSFPQPAQLIRHDTAPTSQTAQSVNPILPTALPQEHISEGGQISLPSVFPASHPNQQAANKLEKIQTIVQRSMTADSSIQPHIDRFASTFDPGDQHPHTPSFVPSVDPDHSLSLDQARVSDQSNSALSPNSLKPIDARMNRTSTVSNSLHLVQRLTETSTSIQPISQQSLPISSTPEGTSQFSDSDAPLSLPPYSTLNFIPQPSSTVSQTSIQDNTGSTQSNSLTRLPIERRVNPPSQPKISPISRQISELESAKTPDSEVIEVTENNIAGNSGLLSNSTSETFTKLASKDSSRSNSQPIASRMQRIWIAKHQSASHASQTIQPAIDLVKTSFSTQTNSVTNTKNIKTIVNQSIEERRSLFSPAVTNSNSESSASQLLKSSKNSTSASITASSNSQNQISDDSAEPIPTIHISIGRVEVRNTQPSSTPQRSRITSSQPRNPALSLENYLKQRNRS